MTNNIVNTSSDLIWQEAIEAFSNCADTVHEKEIVQGVKESGVLLVDDVVSVFDDNANGELDIFDNKVWSCKSFLTQYIDQDFELKLFDDFETIMANGLPVDQIKLLDRIKALSQDEEVELLKWLVDYVDKTKPDTEKDVDYALNFIVLKKIYYRLYDLGQTQILQSDKWQVLSIKFDAELSDEWHQPSYEGRSPDKILQSQLSFYHMAQNTLTDENESLDSKDQALDILGGIFLPEADDVLIRVVQGDYDVSLQAKAVTLLGQRKSQKTFDAIKAEVLRSNDSVYQMGQFFGGYDLDKYAAWDNKDKQNQDYRRSVHDAFCRHKLYDATCEVRALLVLGHKDFRWFDMQGADLAGVDLSYSHLGFVDLTGADLTGISLSHTKGRENIIMTNTRFGPVILDYDFDYVVNPLVRLADAEASCGGLYDTGRTQTLCEIQRQTQLFSLEEIKQMLISDCDRNYLWAYDLLKAENYPFDCLVLVKDRALKQGHSFSEYRNMSKVLLVYHELYGLPNEAWLVDVLKSNNRYARIVVAMVLGEIGTVECVRSLIENLKEKNLYEEENYTEVAKALVKIQKRCQCVPVQEVFEILTSEDLTEDQVYGVAIFLGEEAYAEAGPLLWRLMTDSENRLFDFHNYVPKALIKIQNKHNVITPEQMIEVFDKNNDKNIYYNIRTDVLDFMECINVSDSVAPSLFEYLKRECVPSNSEFHFRDIVKILCNTYEAGGNIPIELIIDFLNVDNYRVLYITPLLKLMKPVEIVPRLLEMRENTGGENARKINEFLEVIGGSPESKD